MDQERKIFREVYNLLTKHYNMTGAAEEWASLMDEVGDIASRYQSPICNGLLMEVLDHLQRRIGGSKEGKDEAHES